jgi:uncharacterized protein with FMN-binding domain
VRARAVVGGVVASLAVLVTAWQLGSAGSGSVGAPTSTTTASGTAPSSATTGTGTTTSTSVADGSYTGDTVSTRFGDVEVAITVSKGAITDVTALRLTDHDTRSVQISNRAAPILRDEVLAAQSASVANVSGATYTTRAYLSSLQSALDQAGL